MTDKNREAFEAWAKKEGYYTNKPVDGYWLAWQAAVTSRQTGQSELADELEKANACIQRAAMVLGSTDEWTDQVSMIADFERRFAAIKALDQHRANVESPSAKSARVAMREYLRAKRSPLPEPPKE